MFSSTNVAAYKDGDYSPYYFFFLWDEANVKKKKKKNTHPIIEFIVWMSNLISILKSPRR